MISKEDVKIAYRLLLRRAPENEAVIEHRMQEQDLESLARTLIDSNEFRQLAAFKGRDSNVQSWVCAEIRDQLKIWLDLNDYGVAAGVLQDNWEPDETNFLLSVLEPGDLFVDVGANIGWFSVLAAHKVGPQGKVVAFEARPDLASRLQQTVNINNFGERCEIHGIALSATEGKVEIGAIPSEHNPGHSFIIAQAAPPNTQSHGLVDSKPLDHFTFDRPVRAIKIDVEGAEQLVLSGALKVLGKDKPIILCEIFPKWLSLVSVATPQNLLETMKSLGYRMFYLSQNGVGREIHSLNRDFADTEYFNVIGLGTTDALKFLNPQLDDRVASLELALSELEIAEERAKAERDRATFACESFQDALRVYEHDSARAAQQMKLELAERERTLQTLLNESSQRLESSRQSEHLAYLDLQNRHSRVVADFNSISNSTIWKATTPLRRVGGKLPPRSRAIVRSALKVAWWTVTLQLPSRLKARRDHRSGLQKDSPAFSDQSARAQLSAYFSLSGPIALIIDDRWPQPDRDGGSIDAVNLINALLNRGYTVIFASTAEHAIANTYKERLKALGVHCVDPKTAQNVQSFIELFGQEFSVVFLNRVNSGGQFLELCRYHCKQARIIFNTVDLHYVREERQAALLNDREGMNQARHTKDRELFLVDASDATIVVSAEEKKILNTQLPTANVVELPLGRTGAMKKSDFSQRKNIGFIGGFAHQPNVDAIRWFLDDIWPGISARLPHCVFSIVGAGLPNNLLEGRYNVNYLGYQTDVEPWFESLRLSVAPLRYGAGMKGKVISSMAHGVPCVGTSIAFEGMASNAIEIVGVADTAERFIAEVVELYLNEERLRTLSEASLTYAGNENSISAFEDRIQSMLVALGLPVLNISSRALDGKRLE